MSSVPTYSPIAQVASGSGPLRGDQSRQAAPTPLANSKDRSASLKYSTTSIQTNGLLKQQQQQQQQRSESGPLPKGGTQQDDGRGTKAASMKSGDAGGDGEGESGNSLGPTAAMHWSRITLRGSALPPALRAHTTTVVGARLFVFGGCDAGTCYADLYVMDTETQWWTRPRTHGTPPLPCRAHSATLVSNRYLIVFGGGDGPNYFNSLYILDTVTFTWTTPSTLGETPSARRAHTAFVHNSDLYIYAGGDGVRALADLYVLNTSLLSPQNPTPALTWTPLITRGTTPQNRGYHTTNLIKNTPHVVLYGGSDGHECFSSVHVLDLTNLTWYQIAQTSPNLPASPPRLSHSATQIGSYLFILGGHDGAHYNNAIMLLNLVTMSWETRSITGADVPEGRGYHTAVLCDSRLWVFGGYDGVTLFGDCWALELGASAYLPQITSFEVGKTAIGDDT
ncbi:hypothetical protein HKX48_007230 [Thoreauomyces humboldtii]|nr:hypothetical protein HKX48_007230 [Thoreauomyces humboldtii]